MSSISGVSGLSSAWANANTQRSQMQAKMFAKVDSDSSGGVNQTELSTMLADISAKSGTTLDAEELFTSMDSNSDGSLSSDELASGLQSVMPPPPSTMEFAQNRSGQSAEDDLFAKVDANADGSVDEAEMTAFTEKMKADTGMDSAVSFATLDTDSDGKLTQTEFEAGEPGATEGTQTASAASGPRGAGGPPPAGGAGASDSSSYDPLDTNQDGTVSELERLAGALKEFVSSADESGSSSSASDRILALAKQIYEQIASGVTSSSGSTLSATA
ncbi:EF-hand domain-containing protein [Rhodoferax sp. 4810]|nr:EF-hand domain-containing protein [Rhodoferax jenense]